MRQLSKKKVKKLKDCFIFSLVASGKKPGATELSGIERGDFNLDWLVEHYRILRHRISNQSLPWMTFITFFNRILNETKHSLFQILLCASVAVWATSKQIFRLKTHSSVSCYLFPILQSLHLNKTARPLFCWIHASSYFLGSILWDGTTLLSVCILENIILSPSTRKSYGMRQV